MSPLRLAPSVAVLGSTFVAATPAGAGAPLPGEPIAAGVSAAGLNVAGMTVADAAQAIEDAYGARLREGLLVRAADIDFTLTSQDAKVRLDAVRSAKRALYAGRAAAAVAPAPGASAAGTDVPLAVEYSEAAVRDLTRRVERRLTRAPVDAKLRISIRRVRVTHSKPGRGIDAGKLRDDVAAALTDPRLTRVFMPALVATKPKVSADKLRDGASTVITIEQSTFTLRLFKRLKVVKTYKVAVGQSGYPTPYGRFAIQSKQVNPVWSVPNSPWAGELAGSSVSGGSAANPLKARWMGVTGSVGIHGTGQDYSIGTRASHGCIRMHVGDVIALFERVPLGTPVLIG